jgi:hypothetical protein
VSRGLPANVLLAGIARLAVFDRSGFAAIGKTKQAFLSSLSPLLAFLLVGTAFEAATTGAANAYGLQDGLQTLCILLGQPVVSNLFARLAGRQEEWLRYATAMNWCQLVLPLVVVVFAAVAWVAGMAGLAARPIAYGLFTAVLLYAVVLNWFLIWRGLNLSKLRAVLFLLAVTATLAFMLTLPAAARLAQTGTVVPRVQT